MHKKVNESIKKVELKIGKNTSTFNFGINNADNLFRKDSSTN
jgi:hypothetical protein